MLNGGQHVDAIQRTIVEGERAVVHFLAAIEAGIRAEVNESCGYRRDLDCAYSLQ